MKRLLICCIFFLALTLHTSPVYWREGNVFNGYFTEPFEISYVIFWDGYILKTTSNEEWRIDLPYWEFKEALKRMGRKVEDIAIKIHNHLPGGSFSYSDEDLSYERAMREDGFVGSYCLRTPGGKIRTRRDKNAALIQLLKKKDTKKFLKKYKKEYPEAYQELVSFLKEQIK